MPGMECGEPLNRLKPGGRSDAKRLTHQNGERHRVAPKLAERCEGIAFERHAIEMGGPTSSVRLVW